MFRRNWLAGALSAAGLSAAGLGAAACGSAAQPSTPPGATPASGTAPSTSAGGATAGQAAGQAAPAKLNLNTATREQLLTVPNVGDRMVREFLEYRPYRSIQQFRREIGKYVSQEQVAAYEQHVFVPVSPNQADAETLRQLPGVDAATAAQLINGRPFANDDAFLTRLGQLTSPAQAAAARVYLA
jgi:DNA uptake protein ComE-like DNA-binding protein